MKYPRCSNSSAKSTLFTVTSGGTSNTIGEKFKTPWIPAATNRFATDCANSAGTHKIANFTGCSVTNLSNSPSAITGTDVTRTRATSGFASNAATTSKPSFSKPGYRNNADPRFPAPTKITGCKCSRPNVSRIVFPNNSTGYPNPRVPNCPKYAKSFRNCAGFTPAAFAKVVELTISTPLSNSFCKQR